MEKEAEVLGPSEVVKGRHSSCQEGAFKRGYCRYAMATNGGRRVAGERDGECIECGKITRLYERQRGRTGRLSMIHWSTPAVALCAQSARFLPPLRSRFGGNCRYEQMAAQ